jgi:hypothetical protein
LIAALGNYLIVDIAGTRGVLMGSDHTAVHPDRPVRAVGQIGVAAQLLEDPGQGAVA